jgi:uncharacterized protein YdaU (DUF1376 family)
MKDIKHVQLEAGAFISDVDFQLMNAEQRGIYCSIILYLYANGGIIELNNTDITLLSDKTNRLAMISNCNKTGQEWKSVWGKIAHKFQINGNILTHKRVTEELKKASDFRIAKSKAGKKGMQKRWADNTDITKESKVKISKVNISKEEVEDKEKKSHTATTADCIISAWQKLPLPMDKKKFAAADVLAIERQLSILSEDPIEPLHENIILEAIENYKKALSLPDSQTYKHTLYNWLFKGHVRKYTSWAFDIEHHDASKFKKGNKTDTKTEYEKLKASGDL